MRFAVRAETIDRWSSRQGFPDRHVRYFIIGVIFGFITIYVLAGIVNDRIITYYVEFTCGSFFFQIFSWRIFFFFCPGEICSVAVADRFRRRSYILIVGYFRLSLSVLFSRQSIRTTIPYQTRSGNTILYYNIHARLSKQKPHGGCTYDPYCGNSQPTAFLFSDFVTSEYRLTISIAKYASSNRRSRMVFTRHKSVQ